MTSSHLHLQFGPAMTTLTSPEGGAIALGPSPAALAQRCFRQGPPTAVEIEHAIDIVEDGLMAARLSKPSPSGLTTSEPTLRRLPGLEVVGATLSREAVESLFQQLASIALGMPNRGEAMAADPEVAAALLITRECMHHLGFESIRIDVP